VEVLPHEVGLTQRQQQDDGVHPAEQVWDVQEPRRDRAQVKAGTRQKQRRAQVERPLRAGPVRDRQEKKDNDQKTKDPESATVERAAQRGSFVQDRQGVARGCEKNVRAHPILSGVVPAHLQRKEVAFASEEL
jgi:hypothetical protein